MGNSTSSIKKTENQFDNFYDVVDYIATYYILTMDFKSLSKLSEKAYCDKLVVLTSDIIERYFNDMEVTFLAQRIKDGIEVNNLETQKIRFINKDNLESLDVSNDVQKSIRKKRVCIGIAKFYVKIAHIFSAIVMTINPVYTYKDATGQTVKTSLLEKDTIPKNIDRKLYKLNICDNRIRALKKGENVDETTNNVTIQPKVCDMNLSSSGTTKTLADEPGIQELMRLYLDDNYDYSNGTFTGMSKKTEQQFRKDLQLFYTAFTGEQNMPDNIQKFSDIKLRDYSKKPGCQLPNNILNQKYTLNKKDELFVKYANNIKNMIQKASDNQYKLLEVINMLFTYVNDPYTGKRVIRVNPKLTDSTLQDAIVKTRKYIIDLYVKCESDYVTGVQIYEAIVESKIVETTQKQIDNLKKQAKKIITETKKISNSSTSPSPTVESNNITPVSSISTPANINPNPTTNITQNPTTNIIPNPVINAPANINPNPTTNITQNPTTNITQNPTTNIIPNPVINAPANINPNPTTNITQNPTTNIIPNPTTINNGMNPVPPPINTSNEQQVNLQKNPANNLNVQIKS
jgi:hypothetical protein